jgi:hypothetical protein
VNFVIHFKFRDDEDHKLFHVIKVTINVCSKSLKKAIQKKYDSHPWSQESFYQGGFALLGFH